MPWYRREGWGNQVVLSVYSSSSFRKNIQRIGRVIYINLGLIIGALVAAEIFFDNWILGPDYDSLNVNRDKTSYFDVSEFIKPGKVVTYKRDQFGLRGYYGASPANIDVLVIGGSTTDERFLDERETWIAQLQGKFMAAGHDLAVTNAAIDGQSTRGYIRAFDLWLSNIPKLKPKYVIAYLEINDVAVVTGIGKFDDMRSPSVSRQMGQYIMNHSDFYDQFSKIKESLVARWTTLMHGANAQITGLWMPVSKWTSREIMSINISQKLDDYNRRLQALSFRIKKLGAEPIYVTQPRGDYRFIDGELEVLVQENQVKGDFELSHQTLVQMFPLNEVTLAFCRDRKLYCIVLAGNIDLTDNDLYDDLHTPPSGSKKIANYIFTNFRRYLKQKGSGT